jgi:hypothetical protein
VEGFKKKKRKRSFFSPGVFLDANDQLEDGEKGFLVEMEKMRQRSDRN